MDRNDAAFAVDVLESRILGDTAKLECVAGENVGRLYTVAQRVRACSSDWLPAAKAAIELERLARTRGMILAGDPDPDLQIFVDKMRGLIAEPGRLVPANRAARRAAAAKLPRRVRRAHFAPPVGSAA